jgi:hypothetical protein
VATVKAEEERRRAVMEAAERQARTGADRFYYTILAIISGVITFIFAIGGLLLFSIPIIPDHSPSSVKIGAAESAIMIAIALILFLFSYFLGRATQHCLEKTR